MLISEKWLQSLLKKPLKKEILLEGLTMAGLEVEDIIKTSADFSNVFIAEVISCQNHVDSKKLKIVEVSTGEKNHQVICGAPNVNVGQKVPLALPGAILLDDKKIEITKIRGIESNGMLCAESELGLNYSNDKGLMILPHNAPIGEKLCEYLDLDDYIIDIALTPNRSDCLSAIGIAREIQANFDSVILMPEVATVKASIDKKFTASVTADKECPLFFLRAIENINSSADTPVWIKNRLIRSGIRCIDPVVDITNYVMLELGQPMHGYDLDKLDGEIIVRLAKKDEKITLLDDNEYKLHKDDLLITDKSRPLALAGIMGAKDSGINNNTKNILLEAAFFSPGFLSGKARRLGLHTESSHRFERGVDYELQTKAINRATDLILQICGGKVGPITERASSFIPEKKDIVLREKQLQKIAGIDFKKSLVENILKRLGFSFKIQDNGWKVTAPSFRLDIVDEIDLVEEVIRIYGYNNLPEAQLLSPLKVKNISSLQKDRDYTFQCLKNLGYSETINYSMIDADLQQLCDSETVAVKIKNPITKDMAVMRTSLLPGLIKSIIFNLKRRQNRIKLFEFGQVFLQFEKEIKSQEKIAGVICGLRQTANWFSEAEQNVDFYDIKGDVESLLNFFGNSKDFTFKKITHNILHPGQSAGIYKNTKLVGCLGAVHPTCLKKFNIKDNLFIFELDQSAILQRSDFTFKAVSKFPGIIRDMAIVVSEKVNLSEVIKVINDNSDECFESVSLFDVYTGQGLEKNTKSFGFRLTWKHPLKTLTDSEVDICFENLCKNLKLHLNATLR